MAKRPTSNSSFNLRATRPNLGIRSWYKKELFKLMKSLQKSILKWIYSFWERNERFIKHSLKALRHFWEKRFLNASEKMADRFVMKVDQSTTTSMKSSLVDAGLSSHKMSFAIRFKNTPHVKEVFRNIRHTQIKLIRGIPIKAFDTVEKIVTEGVLRGRDIHFMQKALKKALPLSSKRALLIATDQNNKATEAIKRARDTSIGIKEGIWMHIPGRKSERETHKKMHGKHFDLEGKGLFDKDVGRCVLPGELISCCCTYRPCLPF